MENLKRVINDLTVGELRTPVTREMIMDYILCIKAGVSLSKWLEDVFEAPQGYAYMGNDLEEFLSKHFN